jgi:RNA polymerase sigma factor (sigma-70 family)
MNVDNDLLKRCASKDRRAQFQLYRSCFSILMGICVRYEKNEEDAKSLLNQGFYKIIMHLDKYKTDVPFEAWIRRIMLNTVIDEFRKKKKERERLTFTDFEQGHFENDFSENSGVLEKLDAEELEIMIHQLPPMSKQVFNLFAIDGYSHQEIADQLGISEGTSKWHVSSARKILKEKISEALINAKMMML